MYSVFAMEDDAKEQQEQSSQRESIKGGTLAHLADIRLGPVSLNLRILLEPIGFLRILLLVGGKILGVVIILGFCPSHLQILSIFAFPLTVGYVGSSQASCFNAANNSVTVLASYNYPYRAANFRFQYPNVIPPPSTLNCTRETLLGDRLLSGAAEFYVTFTVLTFLYCLVILPVYAFLYTVPSKKFLLRSYL